MWLLLDDCKTVEDAPVTHSVHKLCEVSLGLLVTELTMERGTHPLHEFVPLCLEFELRQVNHVATSDLLPVFLEL